ncbi:SDR family NAD(P)-dependent oxidoreductase [Enterobacter sp. R1(2018)]|uniref:SDR family NAD(P)-dependent oxidoreductase n=1 Tax=Enterobacter sp. R1(2018) TaxID=2447891 RepID=UPI000EB21493|nr:SDR family oxidoreductase [Enterobacter sp. R1(2018)]RKQ38460.1 SDR family oxidoreductase [Enterobacter sp. R1(2018)]
MSFPETPTFCLGGKQALVTGGSKGIGFAAAVALAKAGARVWIAARSRQVLTEAVNVAAAHDVLLHALELDITDDAQVARVIEELPPLDILVNSAGMARHAPFSEASMADYDAVMAVNVRATFYLSQQVVRRMQAAGLPGAIIHVSSQMGHVGGKNRSVYCASKFALEGLTRAMAIELGPHNIRVNTLCPTFIDTALSRQSLADPDFYQYVMRQIALGRAGELEDIMGPVVFLASPAAAMITGTSLLVDGGWTAS